MSVLPPYIKDGYLLEEQPGAIIPFPIAKIDSEGNEISLSMEEIDAWQENYIKEHPEVQARLDEIKEDRLKTIEENSKIRPPLIERIINAIVKRY